MQWEEWRLRQTLPLGRWAKKEVKTVMSEAGRLKRVVIETKGGKWSAVQPGGS